MPPLALLAGGLATRLRAVTTTLPKSMVPVAGEPFIAHQLRLLHRNGVDDVVICIGHLGEQIRSFVGDGAQFGCRARYAVDGARPLGTGGALRQAVPLLGSRFFVMYGDSYLDIPFRPVYEAFRGAGRPALMTVYRNDGRWDASNVEFVDGVIRRYDKLNRTADMHHIDYGLGLVSAELLAARPADMAFDLADLYRELVDRRDLAGFEVAQRFYEIGSPAGLAETDAHLRAVLGSSRT
jgi:MurNAc alpha-1-phosphate uridylyltransferase